MPCGQGLPFGRKKASRNSKLGKQLTRKGMWLGSISLNGRFDLLLRYRNHMSPNQNANRNGRHPRVRVVQRHRFELDQSSLLQQPPCTRRKTLGRLRVTTSDTSFCALENRKRRWKQREGLQRKRRSLSSTFASQVMQIRPWLSRSVPVTCHESNDWCGGGEDKFRVLTAERFIEVIHGGRNSFNIKGINRGIYIEGMTHLV